MLSFSVWGNKRLELPAEMTCAYTLKIYTIAH